ncbi:phosphatidylinositol-specific phospholipase C [Vibrio splendidus]|uniref:1-phosphatidylinositol phosphodiesterase n=3 Tax=Vibrionaceae TaxID=641 RepID=A0A2T5E342_VIBSP|nr:phosphatidylinositol-specific phospholipase C [Vibrio splendidus]OEE63397.1 phosphatidylinositol diacylglycerol-lyase [Vibrio splendidus FF-6]PTP13745.1 phosphatidylinositol diacylglycerol-lyase [Vibrio splendidus]TKG01814.1 phosphatidylinositol-specific phospholipase C domain-containing protein [Vibrio lentus]
MSFGDWFITKAQKYSISENNMADVSTKNWMSALDKNLTLDSISMPGTHDSGTQKALKGGARTQNFGIYDQLSDGIRFLDIRVKPNGPELDPLNIYHGDFSCGISFGDVLNDCLKFLSENPSESVVMLMNAATNSDKDIQTKFDEYLKQEKYKHLFYLEPRIPALHEAQSKIVLLRRFDGDEGIDLSNGWEKNATFTLTTPENQVFRIEDEYQQHDTHKKMATVHSSINRAMETPNDNAVHITYNSISLGGHSPYQYAWGGGFGKVDPKMNPGLTEFLAEQQKGKRFGIVVLDFYNNEEGHIDNRNAELIINANSGVDLKNSEYARSSSIIKEDHSYLV